MSVSRTMKADISRFFSCLVAATLKFGKEPYDSGILHSSPISAKYLSAGNTSPRHPLLLPPNKTLIARAFLPSCLVIFLWRFIFHLGDDVCIFCAGDYWDVSVQASPRYNHVGIGVGIFIITSACSCFNRHIAVLGCSSLPFLVGLFLRSATVAWWCTYFRRSC